LDKKLKKNYSDTGFEVLETGGESGGIKFIKDNSWIWFRQSKTEDKVVRVIVDSKNEEVAKQLLEEGKNFFN
jgi:phosphomannomutase